MQKQPDYGISEDTKPKKIPLKVIFPTATTDTILADFATSSFFFKFNGEIVTALIKDGKIHRLWMDNSDKYQSDFDDDEFDRFGDLERRISESVEEKYDEKIYSTSPNSRRTKFLEAANKLKPYYGDELWDVVMEWLELRTSPPLDIEALLRKINPQN